MTEKYNIFIEGIPGSGKSTLLDSLAGYLTEYKVFREGDISPFELAWCAYMNEEEYSRVLAEFADLRTEIVNKTVKEKTHFITAYTKVCTENYLFYQYMEKYEIYGGRKNPLEFKSIVMQRIHDFRSCGNLFECSFFQNIMEELMLFAMYSEQQIEEFYKEIISMLDMPKFKFILSALTKGL